ncbi:flavin reductase family protein [Ruicaihuangia caeni]|uniref:Flavin reductase family protein n=1 Tax=Ruicaihuangia caeni TaxID=3042517 RepID=A0AAW6T813_9MICO|nr:flavin reductase family protein [Klugiella sp. YN-L-19]MDI2099369.1 flavin reductase family protein [Klugiella sp. YN-L-19]
MELKEFDLRELRSAFGRFATGVTVVTYEDEGEIRGFTANSFTSVSLDPPLVLVSVGKHARAADRLAGKPFTINVLSDDQIAHAFQFSGKPQLDLMLDWERTAGCAPALVGTAASFRCMPWQVVEAGDHDLHIGRLTAFSADSMRKPLVFLDGQFTPAPVRAA